MMDDPRMYQVSVPLQSGNSGGALVNSMGEVVGVTTSKLNAVAMLNWKGELPENVNYAIKSAYVKALIESIQCHDKRHPLLPSHEASLEVHAENITQSVVRILCYQ